MCKQKQMKPQVLPKPDSKLSWRKADCIWTIHIFSDTEKEEQGGRWWLAFVRETRPWKQEQLELVSTWQRRWLSFMQSFFTNFSSGITLCYVLQRVFQIWYFSCKFKTQLKFQCWNNYTCGMCSSYWCLASNTIWFWLAEDSYHSSTLASGNYQYFRELFLPYCLVLVRCHVSLPHVAKVLTRLSKCSSLSTHGENYFLLKPPETLMIISEQPSPNSIALTKIVAKNFAKDDK